MGHRQRQRHVGGKCCGHYRSARSMPPTASLSDQALQADQEADKEADKEADQEADKEADQEAGQEADWGAAKAGR